MTLFFKLGIVAQDGLAHKALWNGKGDAGDHYCLLCANIRTSASTAPSSSMMARAKKYSDLALVSSSALLESFQRLHMKRKSCAKKEFQLWEMATGISYDPRALLLNTALLERGVLHPVEQFVHDWMHTVLQGTLPIVAYVAVDAVQCWELLQKQVSLWAFPKAWKANGLADGFEDKKLKKYKENERISLQASGMLTWYPLFRYFLISIVVPQSIAPEATAAFLDMSSLACYCVAVEKPIQAGSQLAALYHCLFFQVTSGSVLDLLHSGIPAGMVTRDSLLAKVEKCLASFGKAGFDKGWVKKFHWLLHLADEYGRHQMLPSCFTAERKHKAITKYATPMKYTGAYERSLLEQVVAQEVSVLQQPGCFTEGTHLTQPCNASKRCLKWLSDILGEDIGQATTSLEAKLESGCRVSKGDVVLYASVSSTMQFNVGEVLLHFQMHEACWTVLKMWTMVNQYKPGQQHAVCKATEDMGLIEAADLLTPAAYAQATSENVTVLLPFAIFGHAHLEGEKRCWCDGFVAGWGRLKCWLPHASLLAMGRSPLVVNKALWLLKAS